MRMIRYSSTRPPQRSRSPSTAGSPGETRGSVTFEASGRSLSDFTVELDVYSGPYEWLLALILKEELEIFEVPLRELVDLYVSAREPGAPNALERDTDFAGSAAALVLLKSRTLSPPRPGELRIDRDRVLEAARRAFSRPAEPPVNHLGPITVTLQELASLIRAAMARGSVPYEELVKDMDRLRSAVAFAAALSLAHEGHLRLMQPEPLGPLTLEPLP